MTDIHNRYNKTDKDRHNAGPETGVALVDHQIPEEEEIIIFHEEDEGIDTSASDITDEMFVTKNQETSADAEYQQEPSKNNNVLSPDQAYSIEDLASEIDSLHLIAQPDTHLPDSLTGAQASEKDEHPIAAESIDVEQHLKADDEDVFFDVIEATEEAITGRSEEQVKKDTIVHKAVPGETGDLEKENTPSPIREKKSDYEHDPDVLLDEDYVVTIEEEPDIVFTDNSHDKDEKEEDSSLSVIHQEDEALGLLSDEELRIETDEELEEEFSDIIEEPLLDLEEEEVYNEDNAEYTPLSTLDQAIIAGRHKDEPFVIAQEIEDSQQQLTDDEKDFVLQEVMGLDDIPLDAFTTEAQLAKEQQRKIKVVPLGQKPEEQPEAVHHAQKQAPAIPEPTLEQESLPYLLEEDYINEESILELEEPPQKPEVKIMEQSSGIKPKPEGPKPKSHSRKVVLDIPDNIRKELPGDFSIEPVDLSEAEMVANENILFNNEDDLIEELNRIHLKPLRERASEEREPVEEEGIEETVDLLEINEEIGEDVIDDDSGDEESELDDERRGEEVKGDNKHQEAVTSASRTDHDEEIVTLSPDELFEIKEEEIDLEEHKENTEESVLLDDIKDEELFLDDIDLIDADSDILDTIYDIEEKEAGHAYFLPRDDSLSKEERQSIEQEIGTKESVIMEEDVEEIGAKLEELHKKEQEKEEEKYQDQEKVSAPLIDITERIVILEDEENVDQFIETIPDIKKEDMRKLLSYLDGLFEKLPEDVVRNFAESEYFELYSNALKKLGL